MQILTVDIGTGTQDILLFDTERTPENCLKLVSRVDGTGRTDPAGNPYATGAHHRRHHGRRPMRVGC
jgi:hypothetical protein